MIFAWCIIIAVCRCCKGYNLTITDYEKDTSATLPRSRRAADLARLLQEPKDAATDATASAAATDGKWYFTAVGDSEVHNSDAAEEWPYLMFDPAAGRVSGNAGCNQLSGSYTCTAAGDITFGDDMISTRMLCPDMSLERKVLQSLPSVRHYTITDGSLTLTAADGTRVAVMSRTAPTDGDQ